MEKEIMSEHSEQCVVVEWALYKSKTDDRFAWLFAIPNGAKLPYKRSPGGKRYAPQAEWLIREGLKSGVADLCFPYSSGIYHALYIELKWYGNHPTEEQIRFIEAMRIAGNATVVAYGADEAIKCLEAYASLPYASSLDCVFKCECPVKGTQKNLCFACRNGLRVAT